MEKVAVDGLPVFGYIYRASRLVHWHRFSLQAIQQQAQSICYPLFALQLHPTMAFVNMDSVHFYQPPSMAGRPGKRRSAASNLDVCAVSNESYNSMTLEPSSNPSGRLEDYDLIESLDLTVSLPGESLDLFREPTVDPRDAQSHAPGTPHPRRL